MSAWQAWLGALGLLIPVAASVWCWRDARHRGKTGGFWAFCALTCLSQFGVWLYVAGMQGLLT